MIIRNAKIEDAKILALLHKQVFGEIHFTTNFSILLLTKYFENLIEQMKYSIIINENEEIAGYLFAGTNSGQIINGFLRSNFLKVFFCLLQNPRFILEKLIELLNKFNSKNKQTTGNEVSLYLIAVDTRLGKRGLGQKLTNHFEELVKSNNENSYTLSVRKNNQQAIDFYLKNNFIQIGKNEKSIKFRREFDS